jgi:type I restriction enzyme R subunit
MLGRATRRCDEIGKEVFHIFDATKIYETLEDYTQMKPVVANPSASFKQLANELDEIESEKRTEQQIKQIIAKIQRKKPFIQEEDLNKFEYNAQGLNPDQLAEQLKSKKPEEAAEQIKSYQGLWKFLDEFKPAPKVQLVSEHQDEFQAIERGYGKAKKPEDYLESFSQFIKENQNKMQALKLICTRPAELDRQSLKELLLALDQEGYNEASLKVAWKEARNEDIAADIIAYIRTLALGTSLKSREERAKNAMDKIRVMKDWNKGQLKWIERFEKKLVQESILQKEDLNRGAFKEYGGFDRINKIFEEDLENIIKEINQNLYTDIA